MFVTTTVEGKLEVPVRQRPSVLPALWVVPIDLHCVVAPVAQL